ncbi:2-hydroxyacid dehydrogenase [Rathayibacter sp. KR2-224]|uniref:2-hydroxyacid dehydrogenase n=1 Tax=Rathayibacter sp. KR2-224 TaxID=3400913 RepID=UPI003C00B1F0
MSIVVSIPGSALLEAYESLPGAAPQNVEFVQWDLKSPPPRDEFDIVVPPYMGGPKVLGGLAGVRARLVQSQSIGYDGVAAALPAGMVFANASSVHETSTAELALALMLAAQRGIPDFVRASERGEWAPARYESVADRRVLIVGYGGVGKAVEERLAGFEVEITRVASRARDEGDLRIHGIDELPQLLPDADIVVIGTPLTDATRHLVDDEFLSALPAGALVVNVARGAVADTDAVLKHAAAGRLRFALDVTDPEPLPQGHPLYALPNVLISPHVGGATSAMMPRMARLLRRQIERMLAGEPPLNVVLRT